MGYYIIYDHALSNPRIATETKPSFTGSSVMIEEAIYFKTEDEARRYLDFNFYGQCAAIVQIIDTYDN
jgi:hypothetical protein